MPGGADLCACCGTHVSTTGQVGAIKILSAQSYKGGTRLAVVCGERAHQSIAAAWAGCRRGGHPVKLRPRSPAARRAKPANGRKLPSSSALPPCRTHCPKHWPKPPCPASLLCCTVTVRTATDCGGFVWRYGRTNALTAVLASGGQGLAYALCLPGGDVRRCARR